MNFKLYEACIGEIVAKKNQGIGSRAIGKELGIGKSTVNEYYNHYINANAPKSNGETFSPESDTDVLEKELDALCASEDFSVANLAKRLRLAHKKNLQLSRIHREQVDTTSHFEEMMAAVQKATHNIRVQDTDWKKVVLPDSVDFNKPKATLEVLFSDYQIGKVGQYYNSQVAEKSIIKYGKEVLNILRTESKTYDIEKIVFASLGDIVEDHLKHGVQSATSTDCGLSEQMAKAIEHIWRYVLQPLASLGIPMEFIGIAGNHGSSQHKGMDMYKAGLYSYDYTIYKALEGYCNVAGYNHVKFVIPEGVFGWTNIYGRYAVYEHGYFNSCTEKSMEDQMKKRGQQIKKHVEYFRVGDMHHVCSYDCGKMIVNGAFFGTDSTGVEYSGILGFSSIPAQVVMLHSDDSSCGRNTIKKFYQIQVASGY